MPSAGRTVSSELRFLSDEVGSALGEILPNTATRYRIRDSTSGNLLGRDAAPRHPRLLIESLDARLARRLSGSPQLGARKVLEATLVSLAGSGL